MVISGGMRSERYRVSVQSVVVFNVDYLRVVYRWLVLEKFYSGPLVDVLKLAKADFLELVRDYAYGLERDTWEAAHYDYSGLWYALEEEIRCVLDGERTRGLIEVRIVPEAVRMHKLSREVAPMFV